MAARRGAPAGASKGDGGGTNKWRISLLPSTDTAFLVADIAFSLSYRAILSADRAVLPIDRAFCVV